MLSILKSSDLSLKADAAEDLEKWVSSFVVDRVATTDSREKQVEFVYG